MSKISKVIDKYKKKQNLTSEQIFNPQKSKGFGSLKIAEGSFDNESKQEESQLAEQNLSSETTHSHRVNMDESFVGNERIGKASKKQNLTAKASRENTRGESRHELFVPDPLQSVKSRSVENGKKPLAEKVVVRNDYTIGKNDYEAVEDKSEGTSIRDILYIIFKRKSQFILFFSVVMCTVIIGTYVVDPVYEASAQVLIKIGRESISNPAMGEMRPIINYDREERINSEIEMIKSHSLAKQVVLELGPTVIYPDLQNDKPSLLGKIKKYVKINVLKKSEKVLSAEDKSKLMLEVATADLLKNTNIEPVQKANIVKISFMNNNPLITAKVTNLLAEKYIDYHLEVHGTPQIASFLKDQTNILKNKYLKSEEKLKEIKEKNQVISLQEERTLILKQVADLQTESNKSQSELQETGNRIESLKNQTKTIPKYNPQENRSNPNGDLTDNLEKRLIELEVKKKELDTQYTNTGKAGIIKSRLVSNIDDEIKLVKQKINEIEGKKSARDNFSFNPLYQSVHGKLLKDEAEIGSIKSKIEMQKKQIEEYRKQLNTLNLIETQIDQMRQQVEVDKENYRLYLKKYEESLIDEKLDKARISSVTLLEPAGVPLQPISPKKMLNFILGFTLAVLGGLGSVFLLEHFNDRLEKIEDFEKVLNLPILATIPELRK